MSYCHNCGVPDDANGCDCWEPPAEHPSTDVQDRETEAYHETQNRTPEGYDWKSLPGEYGSDEWAAAEADRLMVGSADRVPGASNPARKAFAVLCWKRVLDKLTGEVG